MYQHFPDLIKIQTKRGNATMDFKKFEENDLVKCTKTFIEIFNDEPWNDKWTVERAEHYLSDYYHTPGFTGVLALEEKEIVGFIYGVSKVWWDGNEFYIHEMGVKRNFQNKKAISFAKELFLGFIGVLLCLFIVTLWIFLFV